MTHAQMTELEKAKWIDDQIRKGGSVFCPWCSGMNAPGQENNPCCRPFALAIKDRADAMVASFANQYTAVEAGVSSSITCPMCSAVNRAPAPRDRTQWIRPNVSPFCCTYFEHALAAHLEVKRVKNLVHRADQIAEGLYKAAKN